MSTVKSAFIANSTGDNNSSRRLLDRCQNGVLWDFSRDDATPNQTIPSYSTDNGATWTAATMIPGLSQASAFIDLDDNAHLAWRQVGSSGPNGSTLTAGAVYYTRGTPNGGRTAYTWATPVIVGNNTNCGFPDVVACRNSTTSGWDAFVVMSYQSGTDNRALYARVPISSGGVLGTPATDGLTAFAVAGTLGGSYTVAVPTYPSIDFHHTGDAKTVSGSAPNLYVAWSAGATGTGKGIRYKRAGYSGGSWTWGTEREIDSTFVVNNTGDWLQCMYDGTRVVIPFQSSWLVVDQVDEGNTTASSIIAIDAAGNPLQKMMYGGATYDSAGNVYLFGRDNTTGANGTRLLNSRKWTRSGSSLGSLTAIDSTAPDAPYVSVRRGYAGNAADILYTDGTASPWTVTFVRTPTNIAPNAPTLSSPVGATTIDRSITQRFSWVFSDPDTGDTQSAFDLQYRIGAGAWTTVSGTTTNQFYDFAPATFSAASYEWQVRTTDSVGNVGPWSSSGFFTAANTPATPTITAPASGGTISATPSTVTWSAPTQAAYQVRTVADAAGSPDTGTVYTDTGTVLDVSGRSRSVGFAVTGRFEHVQVRIQISGLWSAWASVRVQVSYTPPATPTLVATASSATASISLAITNPAPSGGQPTVSSWDIYRREGSTGSGIRLVAASGLTAWVDRTPASGIAYQYLIRANGSNGATTDSAWTA